MDLEVGLLVLLKEVPLVEAEEIPLRRELQLQLLQLVVVEVVVVAVLRFMANAEAKDLVERHAALADPANTPTSGTVNVCKTVVCFRRITHFDSDTLLVYTSGCWILFLSGFQSLKLLLRTIHSLSII